MLEEEIKVGEQERETLRIEAQRLRDELSDLKIEAEITLDKLRRAEETIARQHEAPTSVTAVDIVRPHSAASQVSATSPSSVAASTPPPSKSDASTASDAPTPPSPPLSETSPKPKPKPNPRTPMPGTTRKQSLASDANTTPRPSHYSAKPLGHSRGASLLASNSHPTPSFARRGAPAPRPTAGTNTSGTMPRSGSLYQIRGLIGKMQKLEERVHSARSKLPAPTHTPPRASPRNGSALGQHGIGLPSNVTVRSSRKRASGSTTSSVKDRSRDSDIGIPAPSPGVSRLSFGGAPPPRPGSRAGAAMTTGQGESRPSSQASMSRPSSRTSTRTPLGHYPSVSRPRSSISGNYAAMHGGHSHSHTQSTSGIDEKDSGFNTPNARRTTLDKSIAGGSGIPTPSGIPRRQSGIGGGRRSSTHMGGEGEMAPPARGRKLSGVGESGVGETY